jgi:hypothetical protein
MLKRKGIALISVVLIGALVFVSIIGVLLKVVPEKSISVARTSSERAFSTAEAAISQSSFDLRNTDLKNNVINPTTVDHYLTPSIVSQIATANVGTVIPVSEQNYSTNPYTTYTIKIKKISGYTWNPISSTWDPITGGSWDPTVPETIAGEVTKKIEAAIYILGTVYKGSSTSSEVAARKAFKTEMQITYYKKTELVGYLGATDPTPPTPGTGSTVWNYGLFSGTDIVFGGNAQAVHGNIFADGNINMGSSPSKTRVVDGAAYAAGGITGKGKADGGTHPGADPIEFPILNVNYYEDLAQLFKTGKPPYDGNTTGFANTSDPMVMAVVQSYLGSGASSTIDQIQNFYNDLENKSGSFAGLTVLQWSAVRDNVKSIVYYIDGDAHVNANFTAQGTIVVNGDFMINGTASIYNEGGLAILVNGDIIKANGTAELHGLFYATGTFSGGGTFDCYGAIVTKGSIDLNGTYNIYYEPITMPNTDIDGTPGSDGTPGTPGTLTVTASTISNAEQSESSWQQISYDKFLNP